jgi:predicted DNA-binding transcriptional regulator YafY
VVKHNKKTGNQEVFLNLEQIDQAISERKQIEFTYMQYEIDKKLHPRRKESYVAEPYGVVYMNEHYYLICSLVSYPKISLYRLDRMKNVRILETSILNMPDTNAVVDKAIYGFTGEPEHIEIRCKKIYSATLSISSEARFIYLKLTMIINLHILFLI